MISQYLVACDCWREFEEIVLPRKRHQKVNKVYLMSVLNQLSTFTGRERSSYKCFDNSGSSHILATMSVSED